MAWQRGFTICSQAQDFAHADDMPDTVDELIDGFASSGIRGE